MKLNIYGDIFSKVYNLYWTEYIDEIAEGILNFYMNNCSGKVLDLCCGTGRLTQYLLNQKLHVIALDQSEFMLKEAKRKAKGNQNIKFMQSDARNFNLGEPVGFVVSTFDSLNHMENLKDLENVFQSVYNNLLDGGFFMFDLNTEYGLRVWDFVDVEDNDDTTFIMYGKYVPQEKRGYTRVTGFFKENSCYKKFDEVMINTVFKISDIENLLQRIGFINIKITRPENLVESVQNPEKVDRVMISCQKSG